MLQNTTDVADKADAFVDWYGTHWRSVFYSFLAGILFTMMFSCAASAYTKPHSVPTLDLTPQGYSITIGVWAVQTPLGGSLGVFEYRPVTQDWSLCGNCITSPDTPNMDAAVNALTPLGYIAARKGEMNTIMAYRYPPIGQPVDGVGKVNQALNGISLAIINGSPALP